MLKALLYMQSAHHSGSPSMGCAPGHRWLGACDGGAGSQGQSGLSAGSGDRACWFYSPVAGGDCTDAGDALAGLLAANASIPQARGADSACVTSTLRSEGVLGGVEAPWPSCLRFACAKDGSLTVFVGAHGCYC